MSDFSDLLHEAEKLSNDVEGTNELPTVDRSLRQVLEASNELYSRVAQSGSKDIQAYETYSKKLVTFIYWCLLQESIAWF